MASIQIPNLPAVIGLDGSELFEGVQAGTSVKISLNQMIAATRSGLPTTLPIPVSLGGTGATTLTGYVKGNGTAPFTASPTIPNTDITGLGTMSTQNANAVAITGGTAALTGVSSVTVNSASAAFTVTQTGAGNAFVVEDSASPDSTPFVVDTGGNVGIGTTTPTSNLQVYNANVAITTNEVAAAGTGVASTRLKYSTNHFGFYVGSANALVTYDYGAAAERMRIDASGNVGIGTTTPSAKLELNAGTNTDIRINTTASGYLQLGQFANGAFISPSSADATAGVLRLGTSGTERMRIDISGNVGIGTTSPSVKLDVNGSAQVRANGTLLLLNVDNTNSYYIQNNGATGSANAFFDVIQNGVGTRMRIDNTGNVGIGDTYAQDRLSVSSASGAAPSNNVNGNSMRLTSTATAGVGVGPSMLFQGQTGNATAQYGFAAIQGFKGSATAADYSGGMAFFIQNSGGTSALTERMRIDSAGYVGIGTTSPLTPLHVNGAATSPFTQGLFEGNNQGGVVLRRVGNTGVSIYGLSDDSMQFITVSTERMRIDASGNVGIGTTTPSYKISLNAASAIDIETGVTNTVGTSRFGTRSSGNAFAGAFTAGKSLELWSGNGITATLDGSANVGIGVTPSAWESGTAIQMAAGQGYSKYGVVNNAYYDGAAYRYIATATATLYGNSGGSHLWFNAPSGTAGNAITFTQAMTLDASGNLMVGTTSPSSSKFRVVGADTSAIGLISGVSYGIRFGSAAGTGANIDAVDVGGVTSYQPLNVGGSTLGLQTAGTQRVLIDASGNITQANATSGNGAIVGSQTFRLAANVTAFGAAIGDFFGATSAISLEASSVYEITIYAVFTKTTAGTATWTLTASSAPTRIIGTYQGSPITGIAAGAPISGFTGSQGATTAAFAATGSLTTAVNHAYQFLVQVQTNAATNFRLQLTQSAGTATPLAGSYYTVKKISATTGTFVA